MSDLSLEVTAYEGLCRTIARDYFAPGLEWQDLTQEARLGAWEGVRDFDPTYGTREIDFVAGCIRRRVLDAVTRANRRKHSVLNAARSTVRDEQGEVIDALELVADHEPSTLEVVLARDHLSGMVRTVTTEMSRVERAAIVGIASDQTYDEIAANAGVDLKVIDNAMQRARRKLAAAS